jgi:hypothetical protein
VASVFVDGTSVGAVSSYVFTGVTANHTISATFVAIPGVGYTLSYTAADSGGTITGNTTQTVSAGGSGTAVTAVPDSGYYFVSWSDGDLNATRTDTDVTGDITVSAIFEPIATYKLTYTAGSGGTITGDTSQTVNFGDDGTAVTAVAHSGYYFKGWSDGVTTAARTDAFVTSDLSVTASFAAKNTVATLSKLKLSGLSGTALTFGKTLTATGSVTPANLGGAVILTVQREVNGKWLAVTSAARTLTASGTYSWTYKPARKGTYRIKTTIAATAAHAAATTMWTVFTVR